MLLAGDVGGTKTNLMVVSPERGIHRPLAEARFSSGDYDSLEALVKEFLRREKLPVSQAAFAVAGPVVDCRAKATNLPWTIDQARLQQALALRSVALLNDLEAIALSVPLLRSEDMVTLKSGEPAAGGTLAVVAPGTGLGEAFLCWEGNAYRAHPSEGGHADFAPTNPLQVELLEYMLARYDHVSYERVCSGKGLPNLYQFLKHKGGVKESAWLAPQLLRAADPTPLIVEAALDPARACPLCQATLRLFVSILGAEAGNLALKLMATGGVYLGGGIPPRVLSALRGDDFLSAFDRKGRLAQLLSKLPIYVILNPKAPLLGAACHALACDVAAKESKVD